MAKTNNTAAKTANGSNGSDIIRFIPLNRGNSAYVMAVGGPTSRLDVNSDDFTAAVAAMAGTDAAKRNASVAADIAAQFPDIKAWTDAAELLAAA